ncbi:MAG: DUF1800 domain-containing protein [Bacteroidota bacterium]
MDRRTTLNTLLGRNKKSTVAAPSVQTLSPSSADLTPYGGPWTYELAAHLLRRCTFGPTYAQIKTALAEGMDATIDTLLTDLPLPNPPLNYNDPEDPNVPIGSTWVDAIYTDQLQANARRRSLNAWTIGGLLNEGVSIREKMVLFWHNHFVIESTVVQDPKFVYHYSNTLRSFALGNFRSFVKAITIDPAMLRYLNGNQNSRFAPNENYARELLELFTIGKGVPAGPGDYTTFTEEDVAAVARVLTGWRDQGYYATEATDVGAIFLNFRHDTEDKQLSHRFNNIVISNGGDQEYAQLIDIIFQQDEVARFICRKLYRWFVYYQIDETIEANVIAPMAQILIDNDYEIQPALRALLTSSHFYEGEHIGCMIKHPIDYVVGLFNQFEISIPNGLVQRYGLWLSIFRLTPQLQMEYYGPPNVAGWKAFYQTPVFYQIWLNSVTLPIRMAFSNQIVSPGYNNGNLIIDALGFLDKIDEPADIDPLLDEFVKILLPKPVLENQIVFLKDVLIPGLPDYEWNVEYSEYASDPGNTDLAEGVRNKVRDLLTTILSMPEYQLL